MDYQPGHEGERHAMYHVSQGGLGRPPLETMAAVTSTSTARQKALSLNLDQRYNEAYLSIRTPDVLARIEKGDPSWERLVPPAVADIITKKLFGWAEASGPAGRLQSRSAGDAE